MYVHTHKCMYLCINACNYVEVLRHMHHFQSVAASLRCLGHSNNVWNFRTYVFSVISLSGGVLPCETSLSDFGLS